jgi:hypothetical protein
MLMNGIWYVGAYSDFLIMFFSPRVTSSNVPHNEDVPARKHEIPCCVNFWCHQQKRRRRTMSKSCERHQVSKSRTFVDASPRLLYWC